jgi:hypothetical protein
MKEQGCYYLHIYYPSKISLETKDAFIFVFKETEYHLKVIKTLQSVITNDFNNSFEITNTEAGIPEHRLLKSDVNIEKGAYVTIFDDHTIGYAINSEKNLYTEFYSKDYTELVLLFESNKNETNIEIAINALEYFINSYRMVSGDVLTLPLSKINFVSRVIKDYFHEYSLQELGLPKQQRMESSREIRFHLRTVMFPFWDTQGKRLKTDTEKVSSKLKVFFATNTKTSALSEFILKAREELHVHKNYKYSFIETWTSLEIGISTYLHKKKLEKGISKTKVDDFETEVGISYLLNIELPLIFPSADEKLKTFIGQVDGIRKLRNKVIHKNRDISLSEAEHAFETAITFLNYLGILKLEKLV